MMGPLAALTNLTRLAMAALELGPLTRLQQLKEPYMLATGSHNYGLVKDVASLKQVSGCTCCNAR